MNNFVEINAYLEEYENNDLLNARLRDKSTNKKVVFVSSMSEAAKDKTDLLLFLNACQTQRGLFPDLFTRNGNLDVVKVKGELITENDDEIQLKHNRMLSYYIE